MERMPWKEGGLEDIPMLPRNVESTDLKGLLAEHRGEALENLNSGYYLLCISVI